MPPIEGKELPYAFVAVTLAKTLEPQTSKKGVDVMDVIGTVHEVLEITAEFVPSQLALAV